MNQLIQDIRYALRALAKTPAFAALAIVTIALGVGANTAVFSMVNGALLRRLPYAGNDRLIHITQPSATSDDAAFSVPTYRAPVKKARVSSRAKKRAATVKKASMSSRAKARKGKVTRVSASQKKATAKRATTKRTARRSARRT